MFENAANKDFRLKSNSPCIGAGENGTDMGAIPFRTNIKKTSWGGIKKLYR
ncbi:MAG: hypothetical protein JXA60_00870 [Candidatus Coatesbacteria bacterium]|nr:hypothetical protein [Candidatus Coatesbacteria bacterium]